VLKEFDQKMHLPIRALYNIKGFSMPRTRVDWRTCKRDETRHILIHLCMSKFKYLHMLDLDQQPIVDSKWEKEDAENVIRLLDTYTKAKEALDQVKGKGWQQCELAHRHALVQLMIGLVGLQEYARIKGYELHLM
jgi:hypothetical protein